MRSKYLIALIILLTPQSVGAMSSQEVFMGVNKVRTDRGLSELTYNPRLQESANNKAIDMCEKNYWAHGDWVPFIQRAGYKYDKAGENLAYGFWSAESTVDGWVRSPGHYANMIGEYNEMAVAVLTCPTYQNKKNQTIAVNHFGRLGYYRQLETTAPPEVILELPKIKNERVEFFKWLESTLLKGAYEKVW